MTLDAQFGLGLLVGYLLGSLPASWLAGRIARTDLRQHGSGNLGATNVYRVLGWRYAAPVVVFDIAKGAVPAVGFATWFGGPTWAPLSYGIAAIVGHVFSMFAGFRGGKGVATSAGVFGVLAPMAFLLSAVIWGGTLYATRFVSLSSLVASLAFPLLAWLTGASSAVVWATIVLAAFIGFTHRRNVRRLLQGAESQIGDQGLSR